VTLRDEDAGGMIFRKGVKMETVQKAVQRWYRMAAANRFPDAAAAPQPSPVHAGLTEEERECIKWMREGCTLPAISFAAGPVEKLLAIIDRLSKESHHG
jgi:hypothetical protein